MLKKKLSLGQVKFGMVFEFRGHQYRMPSKELFYLENMQIGNYIKVSFDDDRYKHAQFKKDTLVIVYED